MVCITFYSSIHWQILVPYQLWSVADYKRRGFLNWHRGMAKHFNIVSLLLHHPMNRFMVGGMFWTSFVEFGSPFCGPGKFPGGLDLALHEGMVRHSSYYLLLPHHPRYTLVYQYPYLFNAKHLPLGVLSLMALRDGEAVTMLSIHYPTTPGIILELHHL